jgi:site-specific recombinase XerD
MADLWHGLIMMICTCVQIGALLSVLQNRYILLYLPSVFAFLSVLHIRVNSDSLYISLERRLTILASAYRLGKRYPAEPIGWADVQKLAAVTTSGALGARGRAALALMGLAGCRVGELVTILGYDIGPDTVFVRCGKGRKSRVVGLHDQCLAMMADWGKWRSRLKIGADKPYVSTLRGEPVSTDAIRSLVKRLARKAGVARRCHPHGFRHGFAAHVSRQVHIVELQAMLGHAHLAVTSQYIQSLGGTAVDAVRAVRWG